MLSCGKTLVAHLALFVAVLVTSMALPRPAHADPAGASTVPLAVLAFDSSDAEEQADGLTGALRSRVRAADGWSLIETTQSLGMLTAAFACPARPTPECLLKIAEQIKAERYLFGFVTKGPTAGQVTAAVHLFQKGQPETIVKETFADNLKDSNDDAMQNVATRILGRFSSAALGVLVVRGSNVPGEIILDGEKHVPLERGSVRVELSPGSHSVEFAPAGGPPSKQNAVVSTGRETVVDFTVAPRAVVPPAAANEKSPTRKIVGGVTMGAGLALGAIAVVELVRYFDFQEKGEQRAADLSKNDPSNGARPCREYDATCFRINKDSQLASGLALGLGAGSVVALSVGAYLFFTDSSSNKSATKPRLVPTASANSGSLHVVGSF